MPKAASIEELAKLAREKGLASGQWFLPHIERKTLRRLMKRDDYHATRDTVILFSLIFSSAYASYQFWQTESYYLFAFTFWIYCTLYTSSGDSRWHECGHGTAFKTKWKNDLLYEIAGAQEILAENLDTSLLKPMEAFCARDVSKVGELRKSLTAATDAHDGALQR